MHYCGMTMMKKSTTFVTKPIRKGADVNEALSKCFERLTYKFEIATFSNNLIYSEISIYILKGKECGILFQ